MKSSQNKKAYLGAVLWIRTGFNRDADPAFYLNVDPEPNPGSQTNEDPCGSGSWSDLKDKKVEFYVKNMVPILLVDNRSKKPTKVQKPL